MSVDLASRNDVSARAMRERLSNGLRLLEGQLSLQRATRCKLTHYFVSSVAALFGAFSAALFLCNIAHARLVEAREPLFGLPTSTFSWILGTGAIAVALACVFVRPSGFKLGLVLWFAASVVIYQLGLQWLGIQNLSGYIAGLAHAFNLSNSLAMTFLDLLFSYLFIGSAALLLWDYLAGPEEVELKGTCMHCGGHMAFSSRSLGQKILCPHCSKETTLRKPGMLKMSCYFCRGHLEFPTYATGEKIQCPHCKMDITLKEQT